MNVFRICLLLLLVPLALNLPAQEATAEAGADEVIGKLNRPQRPLTPAEHLMQDRAKQVHEQALRNLGKQRREADVRRADTEAAVAESDAWNRKLLHLTPAQVDAWMNAPVHDEATYARIAATPDAHFEAAARKQPGEPAPSRRWLALGGVALILLALLLRKRLTRKEAE